jgi:Putative adhesin
MKFVLSLAAIASAAFLVSGCVVVDSQGHIVRDEKRFTVSGTPDLRLTTFDGGIDIRSGEGKAIIVEIEKRGPSQEAVERLEVDASQDGNRVTVEVKKPKGDFAFFGMGHSSPSARLIVTMPKDGDVTARSGDGSIRIEHVHGSLDLRTGDGSIRATDVSGRLVLNTGDGSVTLEEAEGDLELETGDGGVTVAGKLGSVKLHTGDGSITFRAEPGSVMKDDWSITTGDGGVALYLPSDFGAELDAHTGDGSIRSDIQLTGAAAENTRRSVRGRLGSGGKQLRIRTGDGSIHLKTT